MQPIDKIAEYEQKVCDQVRWKKVHPMISRELEAHILDQRDAYMADGEDEESATDKAIAQMGDPILTGSMLDRSHRPKPQWGMISMAVLFLGLGIAFRFLFGIGDENQWFALRQTGVAITGIGIMLGAYFLDISLIGRRPGILCAAVVAAAAILMCLASNINGRLYYFAGPVAMNCAYLALLFPFAFAFLLYAVRGKGIMAVLVSGAALCMMAGMAMATSLMYGCFITVLSGIVLFGICVHKEWLGFSRKTGYLLMAAGIAAVFAAGVLVIMGNPYLSARLYNALHPEYAPNEYGYIAMSIRGFLDSAKLFGTSPMAAEFGKMLPAADLYTDYLLLNVILHGGYAAFAAVVSLFAAFLVCGFRQCIKTKSVLGRLVSASVLLTLGLEAAGYVAFNLGFTLMAPMALPLLSYGNTANIINLALIGVMLSIFRTHDAEPGGEEKTADVRPIVTWSEGKLTFNFNSR